MYVRDAVESDAHALTRHADLPVDAVTQLIHHRTVRVAERDEAVADDGESAGAAPDVGTGPEEGTPPEAVLGFVAFDAHEGTIHITKLAGDREVVTRLLDEPTRYAEKEGMPVEAIVAESEADVAAAVEAFGFEAVGPGPRFDGEETRRFRLDVPA